MSTQRDARSDDANDEDYDDTPIQHMRPFGSGLHKKTIAFVPASSDRQVNSTDSALAAKPQVDIADLYRSIVLPKDTKAIPQPSSGDVEKPRSEPLQQGLCEVCKLPLEMPAPGSNTEEAQRISTPHESSLAHQLCLPHSHPPSALDRSRMGLSYLESYGWDPDSRKGLGSEKQGIQFPVKAKAKKDTLGIGMVVPKGAPPPPKKQLLDAGKVRKMAKEEKRKAERVRQELFGRQDLEKYLGEGAYR